MTTPHSGRTVACRGILGRDHIPPTWIRAESRPNLEDEGIFLNYVNHAEISYGGGGNVVIDSVQQVVNPIQLLQTAADGFL